MKRTALAVLVTVSMLGACSTGGSNRIDFSVKQLALDLVFSDEELKQPIPPNVIVQYIPAPPVTEEFAETLPPALIQDEIVFVEREPVKPLCPVAEEGAAPKVPAKLVLEAGPPTGAINRHNRGAVKLSGGTLSLSLPFPPRSKWVVPSVDSVPQKDALGNQTGVVTEWDVRKEWYPGFVQVDRLRLAANAIQLVRRELTAGEATSVFTPTPPIDFFQFEPEGTAWQSPAVDRGTGTAMMWEGLIEKREIVDVCGEAVDTWRFSVKQTTVNLADGSISGTVEGERDVYNIAIQYGGLVVKEDVHTRQSIREPSTGIPIVAELDYESTADRTEPSPA